MRKTILIPPMIISIIIIGFLAANLVNFIYISIKDNRLHARLNLIKEGMDIEEVIKILGQPKFQYEISTNEINDRWPFKKFYDKREIEQIKNKYEKLILYLYFNRSLIKSKEALARSACYVYIDPKARKVVFVTFVKFGRVKYDPQISHRRLFIFNS